MIAWVEAPADSLHGQCHRFRPSVGSRSRPPASTPHNGSKSSIGVGSKLCKSTQIRTIAPNRVTAVKKQVLVRRAAAFRSASAGEGRDLGREALPVGSAFSIQQASVLLNVPAPTIRSWERRYGVPVAGRSHGGHRRYTADQLRTLRRIRDEIASGHTAHAAATRVKQEQSNAPDPRIQAFLAAVHRLDSTTVSELLDASSHALGLARTLDEVLFPAMREVGRCWETGRCDVAHEHLVTETSRAWLSRIIQTVPAVDAGSEPILLTCGPQDYHTIGLEAIGALLRQRGRACRMLGARTPAAFLPIAAKATGATGVIMVSHLPSARRPAVEALRGIRNSDIHIFYAGNAFLSAHARRSVPGRYLGTNLSRAADMILADIRAGTTSSQSRPAKDHAPLDGLERSSNIGRSAEPSTE